MANENPPQIVYTHEKPPDLKPVYANGFHGTKGWATGEIRLDLFFETGEPDKSEVYRVKDNELVRVDEDQTTFRISRTIGARIILPPQIASQLGRWLLDNTKEVRGSED